MLKTRSGTSRGAASKKYHVTLSPEEREQLERMVWSGKAAARKLTHARILLKADESEGGSGWTDEQIAEALDVGLSTVWRVRRRFVEEGTEAAIVPKPSTVPVTTHTADTFAH